MELLKFPNPLLLKRCDPVTVFGPELKVLLESMYETMIKNRGMGLAANQVGLLYRMFVMQGPNEEQIFLVNPKIVKKSAVFASLREGCLSAPGEIVIVPSRAVWTEVEFQDETGTKKKRVFQDIHSVCVQHEIDHLNGHSHLQNPSLPKYLRKELSKKWGLK